MTDLFFKLSRLGVSVAWEAEQVIYWWLMVRSLAALVQISLGKIMAPVHECECSIESTYSNRTLEDRKQRWHRRWVKVNTNVSSGKSSKIYCVLWFFSYRRSASSYVPATVWMKQCAFHTCNTQPYLCWNRPMLLTASHDALCVFNTFLSFHSPCIYTHLFI